MEKALCILNPVAGRGTPPKVLQDALKERMGRDYTISFCITAAPGDARQAAFEAALDVSLLICCGGDGTLNEVVTGMWQAGSMRPVFYVPCGTTNDIARTLCIPSDLEGCAALFLPENLVFADAGRFNKDACFTYIAAFGAFTEVSYATSQRFKNKWGYFAYLSQFFKGLVRVRSKRLTATVDGQRVEGRYLFGSVTNSLSIGGVLKLSGQGVSLMDGQLELLLVERPKSILLLPYVALKLLLKKYNTKGILLKKCKSVSFRFEDEVDWTIDGEYGGKTDHVDIESMPQFYQIYGNHSVES